MIDEFSLDESPESVARDLLIQSAHLGLTTVLVMGKNPQGEPAMIATEDLHSWMAMRALLVDMLGIVDANILDEAEFDSDTLMN